MPLPPSFSYSGEGKNEFNYFEKLVRLCVPYLKSDGVSLNFKGYTKTIEEYARLDEQDASTAWTLAKEINAWSEYFSGISNLIQKLYLDSEVDKKEVLSAVSISSDISKVANGERIANKNPDVVYARKKRNAMKSLYDEIESKIKFLERAYYHCKSTCEWANKSATP